MKMSIVDSKPRLLHPGSSQMIVMYEDYEDEDVYNEKSQIHLYMQNLGNFTESYLVYEDEDRNVELEMKLPENRPKAMFSSLFDDTDEETLNDQVASILSCGLITEEHLHYLENLHGGHQRVQHLEKAKRCPLNVLICCCCCGGLVSSTLHCLGKSGSAALHLLPVAVSVAALAFWATRRRWRRRRAWKSAVGMIDGLDRFFRTLRKSVKLVQENEMIAQGHLLARGGVSSNTISGGSELSDYATNLQLMPSLRSAIFENTKSAVETLFLLGREMAGAVPLTKVVNYGRENKVEFDEILVSDRLSLQTIKRLQNVFVLAQSGALLRFALSLCTSFWLNRDSADLRGLYHAISLATEKLKRLESNLNREYQIFYSFGLKLEDNAEASVLPSPTFKYVDVYTGVHTCVLRLQAMLFASRAVEKSIESYDGDCDGDGDGGEQDEQFLEQLEHNVSAITAQIDALQACLNMAIVEVNKLKLRPAPRDPLVMPAVSVEGRDEGDVNQDDYVVEDEVYMLYCKKVDVPENESNSETLSLSKEEKAKQEISKQSSTRMVKELKIALRGKAEEWKMREAIALRKRAETEGSLATQDDERVRLIEQELLCDEEVEKPPLPDRSHRTFLGGLENAGVSSTERWVDENSAMKVRQAFAESSLRFLLSADTTEDICGSGEQSEEEEDADIVEC